MMTSISPLLLVVVACAGTPRVVFHPSDHSFVPKPGPAPAVYTRANIAELGDAPMHSVGTIEVTVAPGDVEHAIERAREKGRELGCWIVVEHDAFVERRAARDHGVRFVRVHGGPHHTASVRAPSKVMQFDCVMPHREQRAER
jgi:hypothetical protein